VPKSQLSVARRITVPTGDILVVRGERGMLECLSLGDYGKGANVKADFLGLTDPIEGVQHLDLLPLEEKWVVTISSQYGCSMGCRFCDVPKVGPGRNASLGDMLGQVRAAVALHPEVVSTSRLNVHFARMGEPTWNMNVLAAGLALRDMIDGFRVHPVVSTMMPQVNKTLQDFLSAWMTLKNNHYDGEAGLQLSINTTDEAARERQFGGSAHRLGRIAEIMAALPAPRGRKVALNFALTDDPIDAELLAYLFPPDRFMCKLTPIHETAASEEHGIRTDGGYDCFAPYQPVEESLKAAGFDVLVFVPSREEDDGLITCGNAVLSGSEPRGDWSG